MNKTFETREIEDIINLMYDRFSEGIINHLNNDTSEAIQIQKISKKINLIQGNLTQFEKKIDLIAQKIGCPFPKEFYPKDEKKSEMNICGKSFHKIFQNYIQSLPSFFSFEELKKIIEGFYFLFNQIYMIPTELDSYECDNTLPSSIIEYVPLILCQEKINISILVNEKIISKVSQIIKSPSFEKCNIIFDLCNLVTPKIKNLTYSFTQTIVKYDHPHKVKCSFSFSHHNETMTLYFW